MSNIISAFSTKASVFRIVIPGAVAIVLLWPLLSPLLLSSLTITSLTDVVTLFAVLTPMVVLIGASLKYMRNIMYRVYEGRLFWQRRLSEILTLRLQKQIDDKLERANKLNKSSMEYKELWYWLRMFPLDDKGDPVAKRPTIVGNVMEGYEEYPLRRYGMDAIFYWYRLGPTLPESFATQLDRAWAEADGLMYVSFSGTIIGFLYLFISIIKWILLTVLYPGNSSMPTTPTLEYFISIPPVYILALLFPILLIGAYLVYRWSIPAHRTTGEYFKAAFDVYRKNISDIKKISPTEKEKWRKTWSYLQYMYVQCPHCNNFHFAEEGKCPYCGKSPVRWSLLQRLFKE